MEIKNHSYSIIKDGFYIPILNILLYAATKDFYLTIIITQKLYVVNYYYHYEHLYHYVPHPYNWIRQFIRFTDTGHFVSFLYYFNPQTLPLAHNVHFIITFAYWFAKVFLGMKDQDDRNTDSYILAFERLWTASFHGLVYLIIMYRMLTDTQCNDYFTTTDFKYTCAWLYSWAIFIYIPWRYFTGDPVYSILANDASVKTVLSAIILMNSCAYISNLVGYLITNCE